MKKYDVLKNTNLTEAGFSLSLTRGEVRDDLDGNFTAPYLKWHCDEKFLAVNSDSKNIEEDEEIGDVKSDVPLDEDFQDLGANNSTDDLDEDETKDDEVEAIDETELDDETEDEDFPDFDSMPIAEVKAYAKDHNVDIAGLKKKADIIDAIIDDLAEEE